MKDFIYIKHIFTEENFREDTDVYFHTICGEVINGQEHVELLVLADVISDCIICTDQSTNLIND